MIDYTGSIRKIADELRNLRTTRDYAARIEKILVINYIAALQKELKAPIDDRSSYSVFRYLIEELYLDLIDYHMHCEITGNHYKITTKRGVYTG